MIQTTQELAEATAFERVAVDYVFPLVHRADDRTTLDLRGGKMTVEVLSHENFSDIYKAKFENSVRPLLFGASWKILDLSIEYGLNETLGPRNEWRIACKARNADQASMPPFDAERDLWDRVANTYRATVEARHCLVHRQFALAGDGAMVGIHDRQGNALPDISASEQVAFCRMALRVYCAVFAARLDGREKSDLVASLDRLQALHQRPAIGGGATSIPPAIVRVSAHASAGRWCVDLKAAKRHAAKVFPSSPPLDIWIDFPDSGLPTVYCPIEDAPDDDEVVIDPLNLPMWLTT